MYFSEYSQWTAEPQHKEVMLLIKKGLHKGVKLFPVLRGEGYVSKKTRILSLKSTGVSENVRGIVLDHVREELNE